MINGPQHREQKQYRRAAKTEPSVDRHTRIFYTPSGGLLEAHNITWIITLLPPNAAAATRHTPELTVRVLVQFFPLSFLRGELELEDVPLIPLDLLLVADPDLLRDLADQAHVMGHQN